MRSPRLAEVVGALSLATDIGMAMPLESGLRVCLLATRLAERMQLSTDDVRRTYYLALVRHIGCTAGSHEFAHLLGDELEFRKGIRSVDLSDQRQLMRYVLRFVRANNSPVDTARVLLRLAGARKAMTEGMVAVCEVAQHLAARLGLDEEGLQRDLALVYERYDGQGVPGKASRSELTPTAHAVAVAETAALVAGGDGSEDPAALMAARSGKAYLPAVVDTFRQHADELLESLRAESIWQAVLDAEPQPQPVLTEDRLDEALRAVADFADLKSPYTIGHSTAVAELAADSAEHCGLPASDVADVRRAGWVHDLGRVAVSALVWGKPGPLSLDEWERVRLHPYQTERCLALSVPLARIGAVASMHHERMDASGYHRSVGSTALPAAARILAAADAYVACRQARPHRPAYSAEEARRELENDVRAGRLDADAVDAVLQCSGHRVGRRRAEVAGLTAREVEVLRLVARGLSTKQIAAALHISPRTAEHHIEGIYAKTGVTTRAAATAFALQHQLVDAIQS